MTTCATLPSVGPLNSADSVASLYVGRFGFYVSRTLTHHEDDTDEVRRVRVDADDTRAAARAYFTVTGETPDEWGTTVKVETVETIDAEPASTTLVTVKPEGVA